MPLPRREESHPIEFHIIVLGRELVAELVGKHETDPERYAWERMIAGVNNPNGIFKACQKHSKAVA